MCVCVPIGKQAANSVGLSPDLHACSDLIELSLGRPTLWTRGGCGALAAVYYSWAMVQCVHQCAVRSHEIVTAGVAHEARKAPGGSYQHNIFHQFESLSCLLQTALAHGHPDVLLWPYQTLAWSRAVYHVMFPQTRWVETCCGPTNVRAAWFRGHRELCGCFQLVCPLRFTSIWPGHNGSLAHRTVRSTVVRRCGLARSDGSARGAGAAPVVRLLERDARDGRQFEERSRLMAAIAQASGNAVVEHVRLTMLAQRPNGSAASASGPELLPTLCEQARWFVGADVIVLAHGAASTNAIFADSSALIVDVAPYAYRHEPSAPSEYYEALLAGTDVAYRLLPSARPRTPLAAAHHKSKNLPKHAVTQSEDSCRAEKSCRLAYRDHCCMLLDETKLLTLISLISGHLATTATRPALF